MKSSDIQDIRNIAKSPGGRNVLWMILDICGVFSTPFDPMSSEVTAFKCGMQAIGQDIIGLLNEADPTLFPALLLKSLEKSDDNTSTDNTSTNNTTGDPAE